MRQIEVLIDQNLRKSAIHDIVEDMMSLQLNKNYLGIYDGKLGVILLLSYYYTYFSKNEKYYSKIQNLLTEVLEELNYINSISLYGLSGLGWALQQMDKL